MISVVAMLVVQAAGLQIGVAATESDGWVCVAVPASALAPGALVTLVEPGRATSTVVATIEQPVRSCTSLEQRFLSGAYAHYRARISDSGNLDENRLWVAFVGRLRTQKLPAGRVSVYVSRALPRVQVRSCTSGEGLHLTAWSSTPLRSRRLWHEYYYLGYDVEPSCDVRDTAEE